MYNADNIELVFGKEKLLGHIQALLFICCGSILLATRNQDIITFQPMRDAEALRLLQQGQHTYILDTESAGALVAFLDHVLFAIRPSGVEDTKVTTATTNTY